MMSVFLAQAANAAHGQAFQPMTRFPGQMDLLGWCQQMGAGTALLLILLGAVYLLYGWSIFKVLITLNVAIVGAYAGAALGQHFGAMALPGGLVGAVVSAAVAYPLMKWAVAVMGGICGALVGASVWLSAGLPADLAWAGAMTGLVGFGMFSFILFRGSIIMYTSIQGALMVIVGVLGLAYKYQEFSPRITQGVSGQPFMLPLMVLIPTILGLIYQQTHSTPAGGGGGGGGEKKK
jgi:hypothetical protein